MRPGCMPRLPENRFQAALLCVPGTFVPRRGLAVVASVTCLVASYSAGLLCRCALAAGLSIIP